MKHVSWWGCIRTDTQSLTIVIQESCDETISTTSELRNIVLHSSDNIPNWSSRCNYSIAPIGITSCIRDENFSWSCSLCKSQCREASWSDHFKLEWWIHCPDSDSTIWKTIRSHSETIEYISDWELIITPWNSDCIGAKIQIIIPCCHIGSCIGSESNVGKSTHRISCIGSSDCSIVDSWHLISWTISANCSIIWSISISPCIISESEIVGSGEIPCSIDSSYVTKCSNPESFIVIRLEDKILSIRSSEECSSINYITRERPVRSRKWWGKWCPRSESTCVTCENFSTSWSSSCDFYLTIDFELGSWSRCTDTDIPIGIIDVRARYPCCTIMVEGIPCRTCKIQSCNRWGDTNRKSTWVESTDSIPRSTTPHKDIIKIRAIRSSNSLSRRRSYRIHNWWRTRKCKSRDGR